MLVEMEDVINDIKLYSMWHEVKNVIPVSYLEEQADEYEKHSKETENPTLKRIYSEQAHALRMTILYWKMK